MLPEIALTAQMIRRLKQYFGGKIAIYHSKFNPNERVEIWNKVKTGEIKIFQTQTHELTKQQIPELDSILKSSLEGLPKLYPAIKRSQQVQTAFQLPIIIRVD